MAHCIPFVSLAELSNRIDRQQLSEDEGLHVLADDSEDVCQQQFRRESKHLLDGSEVDRQFRHPSGEAVFDEGT